MGRRERLLNEARRFKASEEAKLLSANTQLIQLSGESAEILDYFAAIHQSKEFTKQTALQLFNQPKE